MEKRKKLTKKMNEKDRLKCDLVPGLPIIEICDKERVLIENHRGIIKYGDNDVCVKVRYGCVCVNGSQLKLNRMSKNKLVITGRIHGIALRGREGNNVD